MTGFLPTSTTQWVNDSNYSQTGTLPQINQSCDNCTQFKYLAYTITYSVVFPFGFLGNLIALFVFLRHTPKKSASTVFMTNLAMSDICFSLTLPFRLIYYYRDCNWDIFPDWLCRWCVFFFYVNLYTSVLFLMGLSILRYLAVVHPIRNKSLATVRRANLACCGIWLFVAITSIPFLFSGTLNDQGKKRCFDPGSMTNWTRILRLNYLALVLGFLIPFITILACYGSIVYRLFAGRKVRNHKSNNRLRSVYLIAVILSTFLLCFLPYHVVRTVHLHTIVSQNNCRLDEYLLKVPVLTLCVAASNSCLNPLLYYFAGESFRSAFRRASRRGTLSSINDSSFRLSLQWRRRPVRERGRQQTLTPTSLLSQEDKTNQEVNEEQHAKNKTQFLSFHERNGAGLDVK